MTKEQKSKDRRMFAFVAFFYVIGFCTISFGFHVAGYDVIAFWPIFSGVIGYLGSLGVANYITSPKD